ncbi:MAG: outer membrane beta-barrel protein [Bryobacteraceae bacterium]
MKLKILLSALAVSAAILPASAQVFEVGPHGGVSRLSGRDIGTFTVGGVDRVTLEDGFRFGFRMTLNNWTFFGHEMGYAYNRTTLRVNSDPVEEAGTAIHQGIYNFLAYATPEGSRVRPFAAGGAHFSNFIFPGGSVTQGSGSNKLGINYGGGIKVRVAEQWLIRMDVRQYLTGKPFDLPNQSGKIKQLEISLGVSFVM